jgi:hypothetical protein
VNKAIFSELKTKQREAHNRRLAQWRFSAKNHHSTGMKNITERIDILNSIHKTSIQLSITDANATTQEGTKVVLTIPVMGRD